MDKRPPWVPLVAIGLVVAYVAAFPQRPPAVTAAEPISVKRSDPPREARPAPTVIADTLPPGFDALAADARPVIAAIKSDGYTYVLVGKCGFLTAEQSKAVQAEFEQSISRFNDDTKALVYVVYIDGMKAATSAYSLTPVAACGRLSKAAIGRVADRAKGTQHLFDDVDPRATPGRLPMP